MTARGVHFALRQEDEQRVLTASSDEELIDLITEDIEERWEEPWLIESDKAWEPLHRCLEDHEVLDGCFLGGQLLINGDGYIVSHLSSDDVKEVDKALQQVSEAWLRERHAAIAKDEDDFEYLWSNFVDVRRFFHVAAEAGRAVIFTVAL